MQRNDRFSEDVIKIFHNAKGSLKNKIVEWTDNENRKQENEPKLHDQWNSQLNTPHNHAAGEYEPLHERKTFTEMDSNESIDNKPSRLKFGNEQRSNMKERLINEESAYDEGAYRIIESEKIHCFREGINPEN